MELLKQIAKVAPYVFGLIVLAALLETGLEHLVVLTLKQFGQQISEETRHLIVKWLAGLLGIFGCAVFGIDILSRTLELLEVMPDYPILAHWFGIFSTGLLVARGSQAIHDFAVTYLGLDGGRLPPIYRENSE